METLEPNKDGLGRAAEALRDGQVVAYPTETVYGLAVDPENPQAMDALFAVKGRDASHAVLLVGDSVDDFESYAKEITAKDRALMDAFWPGPLSLLLPAREGIAEAICGADGRVCVRIPACTIARELCRTFGGAITSTSANRSGESPATRPEEVPEAGVAICINGGILEGETVSTVYDGSTGTILRQGATDAERLEAFEREWNSTAGNHE